MEELPHMRKENNFILAMTGQIETVEFNSFSNVYCKYCYVYGPDWRQMGGEERDADNMEMLINSGMTSSGYKRERGDRITLNAPIEGTFGPQIVLSFYGYDLFGNNVVRGYSVTHLPTVTGSTKRKCPIFLPQSSTTAQRLFSLFTGRRTEFVEAKIIAMAEGRDVIRVSTHGFVHLSLTTKLKDTKKLGYDLNPQTISKASSFCSFTDNTLIKETTKQRISEGRSLTKEQTMEPVQEHKDETNWTEHTQSHVETQ